FTTYAEMLQLVGAMALGLLIAALVGRAGRGIGAILGASFVSIGAALLLTVTRASQLGMVASSALIVLLSRSRRLILTAMLLAIPVAALGVYYLQQQRQV